MPPGRRPGELWLLRMAVHLPLVASQSRTVLSWLPEARALPSGLKQTV
jgi:hypothetical protein